MEVSNLQWNRWDQERVDYFLNGRKGFQNFQNITMEDFKNFKEIASSFNQEAKKQYMSIYSKEYRFLEDYRYHGLKEKYTYDEVCLLFILIFDEEALLYNRFLEIVGPHFEILDRVTNARKLRCSCDLSYAELKNLYGTRYQLYGFYEDDIVDFEARYVEKFLLKASLSVSFSNESFQKIVSSKLETFGKISIQRLNRIDEVLNNWRNVYKVKNIYSLLAFQLEKESQFFDNPTLEEKVVYLIRGIDPELTILQSYFENCKWHPIKQQALETFGFFSKEFIMLEKQYNEYYQVIGQDPFEKSYQKVK